MDTRPNGPDSTDSKAKPETAPNPKAKASRASSRSKVADTSETPLATMGSDGGTASADGSAPAPKARRASARAAAPSGITPAGTEAPANPKRAAAAGASRTRSPRQPAAASTPASTPDGAPLSAGGYEPSHDDIAARAYELYQQRGGGDGDHVDDWHQAERDLRERSGQ